MNLAPARIHRLSDWTENVMMANGEWIEGGDFRADHDLPFGSGIGICSASDIGRGFMEIL
jgi:hypothetical protein